MFGNKNSAPKTNEPAVRVANDALTWDKKDIEHLGSWGIYFNRFVSDFRYLGGHRSMPGNPEQNAILDAHKPAFDKEFDFRGDWQARDEDGAFHREVGLAQKEVEDCDNGIAAIRAEQERVIGSGILNRKDKTKAAQLLEAVNAAADAAVATLAKERVARIKSLQERVQAARKHATVQKERQENRAHEFTKRAGNYDATLSALDEIAKKFPPVTADTK